MTARVLTEHAHACPVAGCQNAVADPRVPCRRCRAAFGGMLREVVVDEPEQGPEEVVAVLAERDAAVTAAYAARRGVAPEVEWWLNQRCWLCEERRKCRRDPMHPARWVCRECDERYV